jgi:hypothetical protein
MVKVSGPAFSLEASGSLANTIVYSKWKGRPYVRQLVTPTNPKSASQTGMRAMFAFLSTEWAGLSAADKATWEDLADATNISPFNAFVSFNQAKWRDFGSPTDEYPDPASGTPANLGSEAAAASGRNIILTGTNSGGGQNWGIMIFRELSAAFTTDWSNCIAVIPLGDTDALQYTDGPLDPDTYYYNFRNFTDGGLLNTEETEVNATVT